MPAITSSGLGSGLDVNNIVEQLVAAEGAPKTARFDAAEARLQAELSSFGTLKSALSSFGSEASNLSRSSTFKSHVTNSSNFNVVRADAGSTAVRGAYQIEVDQLARSHSLATAPGLFSGQADAVGTGTLNISFGTTDYAPGTDYATGDDSYNSFVINPDKQAITIEIGPSNNSLAGIRDAINNAAASNNAGVRASLVDDGNGFRLLLTSETGLVNSLQISVTDDDGQDSDNAGLSILAFDGNATHLEQTLASQDSQLTVNGIAVTADSNSVKGVIQGVTLDLVAIDPGNPVTVTVERDDASIKDSINAFVTSYNELISTLKSLTNFSTDTGQAGILLGDSVVRSMTENIRREMLSVQSQATGQFRILADIGITTGKTGALSVDDTALTAALKSDLNSIMSLFAPNAITDDSNIRFATSSSKTRDGVYAIAISNIADENGNVQGTIGGLAATGNGTLLTGTGQAEGLVVEVLGGATGNRGNVTFSRGLADRLNSLIGNYLGADGFLAIRTDGIEGRLDDVADDRVKLSERLVEIENRYRKQFTALDILIAGMTATSDFLTTELAALPEIREFNR